MHFFSSLIESSEWLVKQAWQPELTCLYACANGLLDTRTRELYEPTPLFFQTAAPSPVVYDPNAKQLDSYTKFMDEFLGDEQTIAMVEQFAAITLTHDTSFQKMLCINGMLRSGKGTFLHVLRHMVGVDNVCELDPTLLANTHGTQVFIGKTVATLSDDDGSTRSDTKKMHGLLRNEPLLSHSLLCIERWFLL